MRNRLSTILLLTAIFLGLFYWFYAPALSLYFSQDDFPLLATSNPSWVQPLKFFAYGSEREYRPLTQHFYFYLNQRLFGGSAPAHHAMNLLVHLLSTILVGWLAYRWIAPWAVWIAAFVFAFHPAHYFEVFWVSGISQGGYVLFLLLTILAFSEFQRTSRRVLFAAALLTGAAAFLCKEDAVMLPAIITLVSLFGPSRPESFKRRCLDAAPFWILLAGYFWVRIGILGFGLPSEGVYEFGFRARAILEKLAAYTTWILIKRWFVLGVVLAWGWFLFHVFRRTPRDKRFPMILRMLLFPALAVVSFVPTLMVPAGAPYYLSFSTAALGLFVAYLLSHIEREAPRSVLAVLLAASFLYSSVWRQQHDVADLASQLATPIPTKAAWCKKWVEQLQREPLPPNLQCAMVFRDIPLLEWEKAWFIFLPMFAWNKPLPNVVAHIAGTPEPKVDAACSVVWSLASGDVRRVR